MTTTDRQQILDLGQNLPKLWHAPSTTATDRKRIIRLLVREVLVDQKRARGKVWFQLNWQTGAVSEHSYIRRVHNYAHYAHLAALQSRIRQLVVDQKLDDEIATILNAEGFRTAQRQLFTSKNLFTLRKKWGIAAVKPNGPHPLRWHDGTYSVQGAAALLAVIPGTIYKWLNRGRLQGFQLAQGLPWHIPITQDQITQLQDHLKRARRSKKEAS